MKRFPIMLMVLGMMVVLAGNGVTGAAGVITLKYGHVERIEDPQHMFAERFANRAKELTGGRVVIEVYPNAQLGNVQELIDGVRSGSVEMGHHVFGSLEQVHKDIPIFGLPYLFRDAEHGLAATNPATSPLMARFNEEMAKAGNMRVIGCYTRGYRHLSTNFPVYRVEDLKNKKIRGIALPMWNSLLKGMGAVPVPVAIGEVPAALMTGLIVGQENPLGTMWSAQLYETQTHIMLTGHMLDLLCVFANDKVWKSIPEGDRALVAQALKEASDYSLQWSNEQQDNYIKMFQDKGVTIISEADGLDVQGFTDAVTKQVRKDFPNWAQYIDEIQKIGR